MTRPVEIEQVTLSDLSAEVQRKLRPLFKKYPNLRAVYDYTTTCAGKDFPVYLLCCRNCGNTLTIEESTTECSDLRVDKHLGFNQGKPQIVDGNSKIVCACLEKTYTCLYETYN